MKQIPANLLKKIKKAHKQSEKLRKNLGLLPIHKFNPKKDIYEIEVKVSRDELIKNNYPSLDSIKEDSEFAIFYNRDDRIYGIEKIGINGKLKEYYCHNCLDFSIDETTHHNVQYFNGNSLDLISIIEDNFTYNEFFKGFYVNNKFYKPMYFNVNAETNKPEDFYFYSTVESSFKDFIPCNYPEILNERGLEILRVSIDTLKINKIYFYYQNRNRNIFYYFDRNLNLQETLVSV